MPDFSSIPTKDGYSALTHDQGDRYGGRSARTPRTHLSNSGGSDRDRQESNKHIAEVGEELPQSITGQVTKTLMSGEKVGTEFDIPEDAYGATMVAIVRDLTAAGLVSQSGAMRRISLLRVVTAAGTMIFNLTLQLGILYYIHTYIVQTSLRVAQLQYERFTTELFMEDGTFKESVWNTYDGKEELCGMAIMNKPFFMIVLTLWTLTMVGEYRSSSRFSRNIGSVPDVATPEEQLDFGSDGIAGEGECLIIGLTPNMRMAVYVCVLVPKYFILFVLLFEGSRWLATAVSFGDIILNSVALGFVIGVDEVLYTTLLPLRQQQQVASTNFFVIQQPSSIYDVMNDQRGQFKRSAWYALGVIAWVALFIWVVQDVLPYDLTTLEQVCQEYLATSSTPVCTKFAIMGWNEDCYPRGVKPS